MQNILAVLIANGSSFGRNEMELLGAASRLAEALSTSLTALVLGSGDDSWSSECAAYGASKVLRAPSPAYQSDLYAAIAQHAITHAGADIALFPATTYGLEIAPQAGYRIGAAVIMDCTALEVEGGNLRVTKPVYGGKAHTEYVARTAPVVLVMRMRAVAPIERRAGAVAEVATLDFDPSQVKQRTRLIERLTEEGDAGPKLEEARVIVSGGRGVGAKENFTELHQLAEMLGGAVGASRAACDLGWVPASLQIGQTGKKVAPELYVAVGISGASQHLAGVSGARHIIAINTDPKAPIFQAAEIGVVDDWKTFFPKFIEALKRHKAAAGGGAAA